MAKESVSNHDEREQRVNKFLQKVERIKEVNKHTLLNC